MKTVSISGSLRGNVGKKDAKALRKAEKVPCVMYGGKEQLHFSTDELSFKKLVFTPEVNLVKIDIDGKVYDASLQDVQYHPVTDQILHVDFLEIIAGKPINIAIPIKITGTSPGVLKGGKLIKKLRKLKVSGLAENLPDKIDVDISGLDILNSIKVQDLKYDNLTFLDVKNAVVVNVIATRAVETPVPGAK
jgi:large subunit ribosomal protein L25